VRTSAALSSAQPSGSPQDDARIEAVLELLVEAIWRDVIGEGGVDGQVPQGTERQNHTGGIGCLER